MLCDYHVHSAVSCDCQAPMHEQIERAQQLGLNEICFTEHIEINFHRGADWRSDINYYEKKIKAVKPFNLHIKFGIEAGITCKKDDFHELIKDIESADFDFVLASAHAVDDSDPFMPAFYDGKTRKQIFHDYFQALIKGLENLKPEHYSAVAHIDFISKGMLKLGMPDPFLKYEDAPDHIDELFRKIISLGKCIEINTSTIQDKHIRRYGEPDWLHRYADLGGTYVTIGSDAHKTENVGVGIADAMELAYNCGIKYFATFDQMVPKLHRL